MEFPQQSGVRIERVTVSVPDDLSGATLDLRGWLMSAGPDAPWCLAPPEPSGGQGPVETIGVILDSAAAAVALCDRLREWLRRRRSRDTGLKVVAFTELDGKKYKITVSLDPAEDSDDRSS